MPTITIKVAAAGTPTSDGKESFAGHVWYILNKEGEKTLSYGFAATKNLPLWKGDRTTRDNNLYLETAYERTIEITDEQYETLKDFGENPDKYEFNKSLYNVVTNSCVDFVWRALEVGGFDTKGYEGELLPTRNILDFEYMLDPLSQHMDYLQWYEAKEEELRCKFPELFDAEKPIDQNVCLKFQPLDQPADQKVDPESAALALKMAAEFSAKTGVGIWLEQVDKAPEGVDWAGFDYGSLAGQGTVKDRHSLPGREPFHDKAHSEVQKFLSATGAADFKKSLLEKILSPVENGLEEEKKLEQPDSVRLFLDSGLSGKASEYREFMFRPILPGQSEESSRLIDEAIDSFNEHKKQQAELLFNPAHFLAFDDTHFDHASQSGPGHSAFGNRSASQEPAFTKAQLEGLIDEKIRKHAEDQLRNFSRQIGISRLVC